MIEAELKKAVYVHTQVRGLSAPEAVQWRRALDEMGEDSICFDIPIWTDSDG